MQSSADTSAQRLVGLIGGTSWESTAIYYRLLNEGVRARCGGLASARLLLSSADFAQLEPLMARGDWSGLGARLNDEAQRLVAGGAEALVLCTNTMHKASAAMMAGVGIPLLDIRDVTGRALVAAGSRRPLLLGTGYTMRDDFFTAPLARQFGITALVPSPDDQAEVNRIIFEELCIGIVREQSRDAYRGVIARGHAAGADAVIFGCTEIGMLLDQTDIALPLFETMALHVEAALAFSFALPSIPAVDAAA